MSMQGNNILLYPRFEEDGGNLVYICPFVLPSVIPNIFRNSATITHMHTKTGMVCTSCGGPTRRLPNLGPPVI